MPEYDSRPSVADGHVPDDDLMAQGLRPCIYTRTATPRDRQVSGRDRRERRPGMGHPPARRRTLVVIAPQAEPVPGHPAAPRMDPRAALSLPASPPWGLDPPLLSLGPRS